MSPIAGSPAAVRKTKIICTLGPATESDAVLGQLIAAGMDIVRLNMSHARHDWVRDIVPRIRSLARAAGRHIAILMDTQGPAIRTGDLPSLLNLKPGDIFEFTVRGARSEEVYSVDVNYDGLIDDISVGSVVVVDNGLINMRVLEKSGNRIRCEVLTEGVLGSRRHINLPGVKVNLPPLTEKDLADVALGAELEVDYVALSFCREAADVDALRDVLIRNGSKARIIAKIEDQLAVRDINDIIARADAVMVARGDLGIECPMEELPIIQRKIVKRCLRKGRTVIVATHMLESMISNPVPTRAEVTDVANAVFEQADAIMLSGETSVGRYPVRCVEVLDKVARRIERSGGADYAADANLDNDRKRIAKSAVGLAGTLVGSKILVFTRRGIMADYVSGFRPAIAPIYAFTESEAVCRRLAINWGTRAFLLPQETSPLRSILAAEALLLEQRLVQTGDHLIIVSDILAGEDAPNNIQMRVVP